MCVCIPLKLSHSLFTMKIIFIYSHWPVPFFKKIDKILAPTQSVVHICQRVTHAKYFFCSAKIVTTRGLQKGAQLPYRSRKFIATEVWLRGASRKGLEEWNKEQESVSKYHTHRLRNHGKSSFYSHSIKFIKFQRFFRDFSG